MIKPMVFNKMKSVLWINDREVLPIGKVGLWRVIWGNPDRIILEFDLPVQNNLIKRLESEVFNLGFYNKDFGRLDDLRDASHVATFKDCKPNRKWMPQPMLLYPDAEITTFFIEFTCKIEAEWTL
jgi:hypothetical protein